MSGLNSNPRNNNRAAIPDAVIKLVGARLHKMINNRRRYFFAVHSAIVNHRGRLMQIYSCPFSLFAPLMRSLYHGHYRGTDEPRAGGRVLNAARKFASALFRVRFSPAAPLFISN